MFWRFINFGDFVSEIVFAITSDGFMEHPFPALLGSGQLKCLSGLVGWAVLDRLLYAGLVGFLLTCGLLSVGL